MILPLLALLPLAAPMAPMTQDEVVLVRDINVNAPLLSGDSSPYGFAEFAGGVLFGASGLGLQPGLWFAPPGAEPTQLSTPEFGRPRDIVALGGGSAVFASRSAVDETVYLARTDGTAAGTEFLPFGGTGEPLRVRAGPIPFRGRAWFTTDDVFNDLYLWSTDGTSAGTRREALLNDGSPLGPFARIYPVDDLLFLSLRVGTPRLLVHDPVASTTVDLGEFRGEQGDLIWQAQAFQGELWFAAEGPGVAGAELWRSDGTPGGTALAAELGPGSIDGSVHVLAADAQHLFFSGTTDGTGFGWQLWSSDGTSAGTQAVIDIFPGSFDHKTEREGAMLPDGRLVFTTAVAGEFQPFVSDGTSAGTLQLADVAPLIELGRSEGFVASGARVFFQAGGLSGPTQLWATDGSLVNTVLLSATAPLAAPPEVALGRVFFDNGEPWSTEGTAATTALFAELTPDPESKGSDPGGALRLGDRLLFAAGRGPGTSLSDQNREPWRTDGSEAGTEEIQNIAPVVQGSDPELQVELGGRLIFTAERASLGREPWATDGTPEGTFLLKDIDSGASGSEPSGFVVSGDVAVFRTSTGLGAGGELWGTDGTQSGTVLLAAFSAPSFVAFPEVALPDGRVPFSAGSTATGSELWITNGKVGGTELLVDLTPGPLSTQINEIVVFGDHAFVAVSSSEGGLLYRTDGTAAGTQLFAENASGSWDSPGDLTVAGGQLFFRSPVLFGDAALWVSDGTLEGTQRVADIDPGFPTFEVDTPIRVDDRVVFRSTAAADEGFWITDGLAGGTHQIKLDGTPDFAAEMSAPFTPLGGTDEVLFTASTDAHGSELWRWSGPGSPPTRVTDLFPGYPGSEPRVLGELGGRMLFAATEPIKGRELYAVDLLELGLFGAEAVGLGCSNLASPRIGHAGIAGPGQTLYVELAGAPALQTSFAFFDSGVALQPLGGGCTSYLTAPKLLGSRVTDAAGSAALPALIPDAASLVGATFALQWLVAEPGGPLLGAFALSDALEVVVGP